MITGTMITIAEAWGEILSEEGSTGPMSPPFVVPEEVSMLGADVGAEDDIEVCVAVEI